LRAFLSFILVCECDWDERAQKNQV
jgi:hypothetical protein